MTVLFPFLIVFGSDTMMSGEAAAADDEERFCDNGMQDRETGADYADVHFDGRPDEGAGVGVGAVGEGDVGDGVGADDADGADAVEKVFVRIFFCLGE